MLKKLFIHEWKDTWKLPALLNAVVLGLTLIGAIFVSNDTWKNTDNVMLASTIVIYTIMYIASIIALGMVTSIYFWFRFYKNLYTDQGYLMHTLPVTTHELIWSKFFACAIWNFISGVVQAFSILVMMNAAFNVFAEFHFSDIIDAFRELETDDMPKLILMIVLMLLAMLVSFVMNIYMGYASVSIGQLFKKHRVGGAVLMYIALYMVLQMATSYIMIPASNYMVNAANGAGAFVLIEVVMLVVSSVAAVAFYFITNNTMKNKLNLE